MSFNTTLLQNINRNNIMLGAYPLGDAPSYVESGDPIIAFSDLISAPRAGWSAAEPTKGAVVSIWGFNFGTFSLTNTYVTIGGVDIGLAADFPTTWGATAKNPHLQQISFYLNSSIPTGDQTITVTTGGKTSIQTIPIKITTNSIYFADANATGGTGTILDPWEDPVNFTSTASPGDVLYCRTSTFVDRIDGGNSVWYIRPDGAGNPANDGTITDPIGILAYPGETPLINGPDSIGGTAYRGIVVKSDYYTLAGLTVTATGLGVDVGGSSDGRGHRVIGCDVKGIQSSDAAGHIITNGSNCVVFGNYAHGARSDNKLDHAIYVAGDASDGGCHVGYNYMIDNQIDTGPLMVANHQDGRIPDDKNCKSHYFYNNFLDSTAFPTTGIGIYDLSWDPGQDTGGEPEPSYVYNNVMINCGVDRTYPAMSAWGAHSKWFNNTVTGCVGTGLEIANSRVLSCEFKNNIFDMDVANTFEYVREINLEAGVDIDIDTNVYYGSTGGLTDPLVADPNGVETDPEIVADLVNANITQASYTTTGGLTVLVEKDYNDIDRAGTYGLGAIA